MPGKLVLTRRPDKTITIGDPSSPDTPIEITVLEVRGDQVRIGVQAPAGVPVNRTEIWLAKREESREEK